MVKRRQSRSESRTTFSPDHVLPSWQKHPTYPKTYLNPDYEEIRKGVFKEKNPLGPLPIITMRRGGPKKKGKGMIFYFIINNEPK
jgi:hypothetical protein